MRAADAVASGVQTVPPPQCQVVAETFCIVRHHAGHRRIRRLRSRPRRRRSSQPAARRTAAGSGSAPLPSTSAADRRRGAAVSAWKCGEMPTSMRFSGEVDLSSRPMKWKPGRGAGLVAALAGAVVQPLDQRLRRAHQRSAPKSRAPAKSVGWNSGENGWLACRALPKVEKEIDFPRQELRRECRRRRDRSPRHWRGHRRRARAFSAASCREPRGVGRVLQRHLADRRAIDAEDAHEIGGLPAELGLLAGGKAHHLGVEFQLLESQLRAVERPAGQPAGIDALVELRRPAAGNTDAAAIGIGRDVDRRR